jgi:hypothetical protein
VPLHRGVQRVLLRTVAVEVVVLCLLGVIILRTPSGQRTPAALAGLVALLVALVVTPVVVGLTRRRFEATEAGDPHGGRGAEATDPSPAPGAEPAP